MFDFNAVLSEVPKGHSNSVVAVRGLGHYRNVSSFKSFNAVMYSI